MPLLFPSIIVSVIVSVIDSIIEYKLNKIRYSDIMFPY